MAGSPRRGDRRRRDDDRNLFLDLLLSARQVLHLSHTGRSLRDNAPLPPSVLVSDLLDLLVPAIADDARDTGALQRARHRLVVEHPLQAFAEGAFRDDADMRLRSFDQALCLALRGAAAARSDPHYAPPAEDEDTLDDGSPHLPFFAAALAPPGPEWHTVSLGQLVQFFRNPSRSLLRHRLGIELRREPDALQDDEPFVVDWRARSALADRLLPALLAQRVNDDRALQQLAQAGGEYPAGALGEALLQAELGTMRRFADRIRAATASPPLPPHGVASELAIDGQVWRLQAELADLRPDGLVRWRYAPLRAADLLEAWLHHLCLCIDTPAGVQPASTWWTLDGALRLGPPAQPAAVLHDLLRLYAAGLREPQHFFPKSAWALVDGSPAKARQKWAATVQHPHGESVDPHHQLAQRGRGEALDQRFAALAERVFAPLRAAIIDRPDLA